MTWVIYLVGAVGLVIAGYGFVSLAAAAVRRRRYAEIVAAVLVAATVIAALVVFGDHLVQ